jgi:hypothetical protein
MQNKNVYSLYSYFLANILRKYTVHFKGEFNNRLNKVYFSNEKSTDIYSNKSATNEFF